MPFPKLRLTKFWKVVHTFSRIKRKLRRKMEMNNQNPGAEKDDVEQQIQQRTSHRRSSFLASQVSNSAEPYQNLDSNHCSVNSETLDVIQPDSPTGTIASSVSTSISSSPSLWSCDNWHRGVTVRDRNAVMFNNELMSDVTFLVGPKNAAQRIPAHKYVLATGSSVFFAMFYGDLAENTSEIVTPDVEPEAFLTLLKYMYCDEIDLTPENVLDTLYAAKKYLVPHLARSCVEYLERSLSARNACVLLSQSHLFEEPDLMQRCWEVIDAQAEVALGSDSFVDVDQDTLECILKRETLNVKELVLFHAAMRWADAECSRQDLVVTPNSLRKVLGSALYLIRIPTMPLKEFANNVACSGVITLEETTNIFLHYTADIRPKIRFPCKQRAGLRTCTVHRFQSSAYRSNQWRYRGRCDSIQFAVDRRIFIAGFGLYGSSSGGAEYKVKIELKRGGKSLAENHTKFFSDGSSSTFAVTFPHPVQVEPHVYYTASATLCGNELSYFGQEGLTESTSNDVTFQFQCSPESTNGTGVQGGQIPELIFYA
ncbi:BTB/POZ domain-containing protein 6-B-like [Strongylocentrotus purpuratus]|uniref:BTB domain-containing protein n=1 Tax=Strongylocentrotus purpuratus TaxID=7668 RepID=A0A7M7PSA3_STRPU|nr:BTB/POZ domain-containing protein 6-B-like [Strongylocentrotus purpuratus]